MVNAERILGTLDGYLDHPISLVLYGRAAIALGFENPPEAVTQTLDVDVIVGVSQLESLRSDSNFWDAQRATNQVLEKEGLYITHIFEAEQLFLRREWEQHLVPIARPPLRWLRLFRPAMLDLILTKMMRGDDAQDMDDVAFLVRQERIAPAELEEVFGKAVIPDLVELREAFERAKPIVRKLVRELGTQR